MVAAVTPTGWSDFKSGVKRRKKREKGRCFCCSEKLRKASDEWTIRVVAHAQGRHTNTQSKAGPPVLPSVAVPGRADALSSQCEIPADVKQRDEIRRQTARD